MVNATGNGHQNSNFAYQQTPTKSNSLSIVATETTPAKPKLGDQKNNKANNGGINAYIDNSFAIMNGINAFNLDINHEDTITRINDAAPHGEWLIMHRNKNNNQSTKRNIKIPKSLTLIPRIRQVIRVSNYLNNPSLMQKTTTLA